MPPGLPPIQHIQSILNNTKYLLFLYPTPNASGNYLKMSVISCSVSDTVCICMLVSHILYRGLFSIGLYFRCKAKVLKLIPLKFLLQYKSYGE